MSNRDLYYASGRQPVRLLFVLIPLLFVGGGGFILGAGGLLAYLTGAGNPLAPFIVLLVVSAIAAVGAVLTLRRVRRYHQASEAALTAFAAEAGVVDPNGVLKLSTVVPEGYEHRFGGGSVLLNGQPVMAELVSTRERIELRVGNGSPAVIAALV
jgi:hypothetical protein